MIFGPSSALSAIASRPATNGYLLPPLQGTASQLYLSLPADVQPIRAVVR
jgi:hypothetical protein